MLTLCVNTGVMGIQLMYSQTRYKQRALSIAFNKRHIEQKIKPPKCLCLNSISREKGLKRASHTSRCKPWSWSPPAGHWTHRRPRTAGAQESAVSAWLETQPWSRPLSSNPTTQDLRLWGQASHLVSITHYNINEQHMQNSSFLFCLSYFFNCHRLKAYIDYWMVLWMVLCS